MCLEEDQIQINQPVSPCFLHVQLTVVHSSSLLSGSPEKGEGKQVCTNRHSHSSSPHHHPRCCRRISLLELRRCTVHVNISFAQTKISAVRYGSRKFRVFRKCFRMLSQAIQIQTQNTTTARRDRLLVLHTSVCLFVFFFIVV